MFNDSDVRLHIAKFVNCLNSFEIIMHFEHNYEMLMDLKNQQIKRSSPVEVIWVAICGSCLWRRDADKVGQKEHVHDF